jgi:peptide/nickel transport system substrate-binding protein
MKRKYVWSILSCLLAFSLVLSSCGTKSTPTTTLTTTSATKPTTITTTKLTVTTTTATGNWWDSLGVPQYGGTITIRTASDLGGFDLYTGPRNFAFLMFGESLGGYDWTVDRKTWDFKSQYYLLEYEEGLLAESWEQPDLKTVVFHIRKGIKFQDKPPVNGRELTAYDVEYHYHRYLGLGSGFTKPSPYFGGAFYFAGIQSVTATDKYTLVFKWNQPSLVWIEYIVDPAFYNYMAAPREVIEKYGSAQDWKNAVGTSAWILSDYVSGSSLTYTKNPNYWGYDERHPQNRLPYADQFKALIIPDTATALAALRTGKIDYIPGIDWS